MILLQILLVSFGLFMMYVTRIHHKKHQITVAEYWFWVVTWIAFTILVFWPGIFQNIAQTLHIARVFDLLVIIAMMFLTLLSFYNRVLYHQLRQKMENLVRERAMESGKKSR